MDVSLNPLIYNPDYIDKFYFITFEEAKEAVKTLAREEGILVGYSAGAALLATMHEANEASKDKNIVVIFPDTGERYLKDFSL